MSESTELGAVPRNDVIEGHTLSPLKIPAYGELQRHFEAMLLKIAAQACHDQPDAIQRLCMGVAQDLIARGRLRYGTREFDMALQSIDALPFLLHLCLRARHPRITPAAAALMVKDDAARPKIYEACLEMAGYSTKKAPPTNTPETQ